MLGFGNFKNENQAKDQLAQLPFQLPASVKPVAQKFERYKALVNDLGSEELIGNNKLYQVKLKPAPLPLIDESLLVTPKPVVSVPVDPAKTTTTTTITRKDPAGNVVDVKRSQSVVEQPTQPEAPKNLPANKPADQQISDPFN